MPCHLDEECRLQAPAGIIMNCDDCWRNLGMKDVTKEDYRWLYELLEERDPSINISHRKMPTYEEHCKFCASHPYPYRFIAWLGEKRIATWYITDSNEIGIFVKKEFIGKGYGSHILGHIVDRFKGRRLLANIAPENFRSKNLFRIYNFVKIQETYELKGD